MSHEVHAVIRFTGTKNAHLSNTISMRDEIFNQEATQTICWGQGVNITVIVVGSDFRNHRYLTFFGYGIDREVTTLNVG